MRILHRDDMRMRLRCESDDDLWTLAQFVQPGQRFGMVGERRDSTTGAVEGGRAKAGITAIRWLAPARPWRSPSPEAAWAWRRWLL